MNLPNKLTIIRMCLIPVFVTLFFLPYSYMKIVACAVFVIASLTDFLDGYIARKYNLVTNLGKFLDPIADKMLVSCALLALIISVSADFTVLVCICSMVIISRELMVSAFRIIASSKNVILPADKLGKIKTVLQMVAVILLIPASDMVIVGTSFANIIEIAGLILLILSSVMALVSLVNYIVKNRAVLKDE